MSISAATWTLASPFAPWSSRATRSISKPAPASSPTACRPEEREETLNKARGLLRALEIADELSITT